MVPSCQSSSSDHRRCTCVVTEIVAAASAAQAVAIAPAVAAAATDRCQRSGRANCADSTQLPTPTDTTAATVAATTAVAATAAPTAIAAGYMYVKISNSRLRRLREKDQKRTLCTSGQDHKMTLGSLLSKPAA